MKKIKLKCLIDPSANNIDDIYSNICKELKLEVKTDNDLMKQLETKSKNKNSKTPGKIPLLNKKNDEDLLFSMTKRLNIVEQSLKDSNSKLKKKDEEIKKLKMRIKELETTKNKKEMMMKTFVKIVLK